MKVFCYIPELSITGSGDAAPKVRAQLAEALAMGLEPAALPKNVRRLAVTMDAPMAKALEELSAKYGLAQGRVAGALLYALHLKRQVGADEKKAFLPDLGGLRPGQVQVLNELAHLMQSGKIILSECGTGSGKSRIIAHAAAHALRLRDAGLLPDPPQVQSELQKNDRALLPDFIRTHARKAQEAMAVRAQLQPQSASPVIICAPSIENITHLVREWTACQPHLTLPPGTRVSLALGRTQFVDGAVLTDLLDESETDYHAIERWLRNGMPAGLSNATAHLLGMEPTLCGLMADLEVVARGTTFPYKDASLDESADSESTAVYDMLKEKVRLADVIFTTHAMLCVDNLKLAAGAASSILPAPCAVLIDEAHELESTQANMAGSDLSFLRFLSALSDPFWASNRKASPASECANATRELVSIMTNIPDETALPVVEGEVDAQIFRTWRKAHASLGCLQAKASQLVKGIKPESLSGKSLRAFRYAQRAVSVLGSLVDGYRGYIAHSPVQGRISFHIGPGSVEKYLAARWETTPTAMLFSGTLIHIGTSEASPRIFARSIAISATRLASTASLHPSWVAGSATLLQPSQQSFHQFVPPRPDDLNPLALSFWLNSVASAINLATSEAKGGMLVLMTGYERLEVLAKAIQERFPALSSRLVVQNRNQGVASCATIFKDMARQGVKPIWLGTGAAWTGLDLADENIADKDSHLDNLLTDLVIPAVPFGLERTTTHVSRVNNIGFVAETVVAQRRLRQALGRLVRREGLADRKIWLLDGRLQHPGAAHYTASIKRVLLAYIHKKTFDI